MACLWVDTGGLKREQLVELVRRNTLKRCRRMCFELTEKVVLEEIVEIVERIFWVISVTKEIEADLVHGQRGLVLGR